MKLVVLLVIWLVIALTIVTAVADKPAECQSTGDADLCTLDIHNA
jgi:hypothetical protein